VTVQHTDAKLQEIIATQEEIFVRRQPESARLAAAAVGHLVGGVTSSWQITAPQPVWLSHGKGSKVYDVDGNEYVDLHGGYGAALAGHAHPAIARAITEQATRGTHFAQPTPPRTRSRSPPNSPAAFACPAGASPTRVPKPPWTPST
jgi:glutamate-1-semialdehyde 2,1-aminomutase